jgi:mono/diheme cytochrome c family protein
VKKFLKWSAIGLSGLIVIVVIAAAGLYLSANARFNKTYAINVEPIAISTDQASLARGEHWVSIHCADCHAADLGGGPFFEDPALGVVDAPNLTSGQGGIASNYTDEDWVRALRHGVKKDGRSVFIMPSGYFYYFNDEDLGDIIAYMKTVPLVDRQTRPSALKPMAKVLYGLGAFGDLLYAETIPHDTRPPAPPEGVTVEYGEYLVDANGCRSCHGHELSGAQPAEPGSPLGPNLTPGGDLANWSQADFLQTMRTGSNPDGEQMDPGFMPWPFLGRMTDDELSAIWLYLQAQPALETTTK